MKTKKKTAEQAKKAIKRSIKKFGDYDGAKKEKLKSLTSR